MTAKCRTGSPHLKPEKFMFPCMNVHRCNDTSIRECVEVSVSVLVLYLIKTIQVTASFPVVGMKKKIQFDKKKLLRSQLGCIKNATIIRKPPFLRNV